MNTGDNTNVPDNVKINDVQFTKVTTKTTPTQPIDPKFDNDAFSGNDNNRRVAGRRILAMADQTGGELNEVARNGAPDGSTVHKSNLAAAQMIAQTEIGKPSTQVEVKPEDQDGTVRVPATDPALTDATEAGKAAADAAAKAADASKGNGGGTPPPPAQTPGWKSGQ